MRATFLITDDLIRVDIRIAKQSLVLMSLTPSQLTLIREHSQPDTRLSDKMFALYHLALAMEKDHDKESTTEDWPRHIKGPRVDDG
jgi:hypothetical protein